MFIELQRVIENQLWKFSFYKRFVTENIKKYHWKHRNNIETNMIIVTVVVFFFAELRLLERLNLFVM